MDEIIFRKQHPTAGVGYQYTMGRIQAYTTGGYAGGMRFGTGKHTGGGSYSVTNAFELTDSCIVNP